MTEYGARDEGLSALVDVKADADASLSIVCCPETMTSNPYQALLHRALAERGVTITDANRLGPVSAFRWRGRVEAVHVHWIELAVYHKIGRIRSRLYTASNALRYTLALHVLRRSGVRIVWTVHNLRAHESRWPRLERALARVTLRTADTVLVHSRYAADRVREEIGDSEALTLAPHGNYIGAYPGDPRSRAEIRAELGIPENAFVYLAFGSVRRYKRIPEIIAAFKQIPDPDVRLVVVGRATDANLRAEIERAASTDARIVLELGFVGKDAVSTWYRAADAAVLNHAEVFSSGALLLALTQGVPVVAPVPSTADEVAAGAALEPILDGRLLDAMHAVRGGDPAQRRDAARRAAELASWEPMADMLVEAYRG